MATIKQWNPFGVTLNITATCASVTRISATQYKVKINASWESYWGNAKTNYGMTATSGNASVLLNDFGNKSTGGSGSFTGTYSISGNGSATKSITVTFKNYNSDNGDSASKAVTFNVNVPAWTSYTVKYGANGGTGAPSSQTKWKDQKLTLSTVKPTRTGHTFLGWSTSTTATSATYQPGGSYTANASITLYAVWKVDTYAIKYDANGGSGAPAQQTKKFATPLTLSTTIPTRQYYNFLGWSTSKTATSAMYQPGGSYTANAGATLYAVWELAYVKPRITNVQRNRCDASGNLTSDGTYARIDFSWQCDRPVTSITIGYRESGAVDYSIVSVSASGSNGKISQIISGFSIESSYDIRIVVTDVESSTIYTDIPGLIYVMNAMVGGVGVAFGKKADTQDIADFAWTIYPEKGFKYPLLLPNTDLNNVTIPNVYEGGGVGSDYGFVNCPVGSGIPFTLEVLPAGGVTILQRITSYNGSTLSIYQRFYYQGAWSNWIKTY